ncbi:hypothetical protein [Puia sp.]|jgi:hypothetical protein|uniref:hypothetical protein n=1 Tax=Puia sp. TaxID=2045100 RepID=UPI002F40D6B5
MNNKDFFKAMMTGLFIGIIDTVICLAYNIGYRDKTGYIPSEIINVSSLIFAINILLTALGIIYYFFIRYIRNGDTIYFIVFLALTAWLTFKTVSAVRFGDPRLDSGWHGLMGGVLLIVGLSASCIPFFYRSRKFQDAVI